MKPVFLQYLEWHFVAAAAGILKGWRNFLVFNFRFFSIPSLLKTLFAYWRKYRGSYGRGFDFKVYLETFIFNIISRLIGAVMRITLVIFGFLSEIFILAAGLVIFLVWILLPFLAVGGFCLGIRLMF